MNTGGAGCVETNITAMRPLAETLFLIMSARRRLDRRYGYRSYSRAMRPVRPFNPVRSVLNFFWSLLWVCFGLAMAFSPDFRDLFVRFWVAFAHVMAALARGLASLFW